MCLTVLTGLTGLFVIMTLLPLWRLKAWWVRGLDFPRLQISVGLMLLLLVQLYLFLPALSGTTAVDGFVLLLALIVITLACLTYQVVRIIPYSPLFPCEVKGASTGGPDRPDQLRILTANVLTTNRRARRLLELIDQADPDVVLTLESDQWWEDQLSALEKEYPYSVKCPLDNLYGMHFYSRLGLEESEVRFILDADVPSIHVTLRLKSGRRVRLHCMHPTPPSPTENPRSGERDAELLLVAREVRESSKPVVVTGDLNDVAWSSTTRLFRRMSGLLDPRVGRGMYNTYSAKHWFIRWPLDHLFHSRHFTLGGLRRLPAFGSDHFPILVTLVCDAARGFEQEAPSADADDRRRARQTIAKET